MPMVPRTRTNFLQTTAIPGLKSKLRTFVSKLYHIDSQEKSLKTLQQLTQLVERLDKYSYLMIYIFCGQVKYRESML